MSGAKSSSAPSVFRPRRFHVARTHGVSHSRVHPSGQSSRTAHIAQSKSLRPKCHICDKHHPHKVCWVLYPERASADWRGPTTHERYQVYAAVCNLKGVPLKPFQYASQTVDRRAAVLSSLDTRSHGTGVDLQRVLDTPRQRASVARPPFAYVRDAPNSMPSERPGARHPFAAFTTAAVSAPTRASSAAPSTPAFVRPVVVQHPTLLRIASPSSRTSHVTTSAPRARHVPKISSVSAAPARSAAPQVVRATMSPRAPIVVQQPAVRNSPAAAHRVAELHEEKKHLPVGVEAGDAARLSSDDVLAAVQAEPAVVPMGFAWGWSATYGTSLACSFA